MEFNFSDVVIIVAMSTTIILMAFTFSALGLADNGIDENDIPRYNTASDRFNMVGDFPNNPGGPSRFFLDYDEELAGDSDNSVWLDGSTDNGTQLTMYNNSNSNNQTLKVGLYKWESGSNTGEVNTTLSDVGDKSVLKDFGYDLLVEYDRKENPNSSKTISQISVNVREQPETNAGFLDRIPLVGGVFDGTEAIAAIVGWLGSIIYWFFGTTFEVVLNGAYMLYSIAAYLISFVGWMVTTYVNVTTSASGWAAIFITLPGLILSLEFTKVIMVLISLLPTT